MADAIQRGIPHVSVTEHGTGQTTLACGVPDPWTISMHPWSKTQVARGWPEAQVDSALTLASIRAGQDL
eukprot:CAMPEP_0174700940 /NCGR_PEP_ID=MMETSP1094-20130205/5743_1 /TAXON_ID=156173 /ORGANISM="Chrysochromulina brevifilum, Strain UTEX LB 985" /LENGTH=68 /DNA_ID=CAMNT_0015898509 /DNA_START=35 /DNA_END=241 /DNA_ORIENTATION=+